MAESDGTGFETCQIVFWRGYVKCAFYAVPSGGEPVESPFFRSREPSPLPSGSALEAHQALVERLKEDGWEPDARGRAWYSLTFRRRGWSPVKQEQLPVEQVPVPAPPIEEVPLPGPATPAVEEAPAPPPVIEEVPAPAPAVEAHAAPPEPEPEPDPEPEPAPAAEPAPVAALAPRTTRRQRALIVITAALIALAVALGLTLFGTNSAQGQNRGQGRTGHPLAKQSLKPVVSAAPAARHPATPPPTTIVVTGSRGDSWVEARAGSATGKSLFSGVVSVGQTVRVTAPVVWITFGAAGNLDVHVNGRAPVPGTFNGTITALIAHGRVRSA